MTEKAGTRPSGSDQEAQTEQQYFALLEGKRVLLLAWLLDYRATLLTGHTAGEERHPEQQAGAPRGGGDARR